MVAARKEPGIACVCLVLATCRLDVNHAVCDLLGVRKASFASAEQTRDLTGMMIGGVTPFGLPGAASSANERPVATAVLNNRAPSR